VFKAFGEVGQVGVGVGLDEPPVAVDGFLSLRNRLAAISSLAADEGQPRVSMPTRHEPRPASTVTSSSLQ